MNVEIGTEAQIFLFWENLLQIFGILSLQCGHNTHTPLQIRTDETVLSRRAINPISSCTVLIFPNEQSWIADRTLQIKGTV